MVEFTKEDLENLRTLADTLCSITELEEDEQQTLNKFYQFLSEQELLVK